MFAYCPLNARRVTSCPANMKITMLPLFVALTVAAQIPHPTDAPQALPPAQSAAAFKLPEGFRMEAVASDAYFELRLYTVTSNKLDGVLERFRDTVEPVRQKHGITTVGYWTAPGTTNGGAFIYLLAAASPEELRQREQAFGADPRFKEGYAASNKKHGQTVDKIVTLPLGVDATAKIDFASGRPPRAFELRIYTVPPGKLDAFRDRWRDHAVPLYERHGLRSVGWWVGDRKDADGNALFVCLLAGESPAALQAAIVAFHQDPDWRRVEKDTETDGPLRSAVTAYKLTPTEFSPLK